MPISARSAWASCQPGSRLSVDTSTGQHTELGGKVVHVSLALTFASSHQRRDVAERQESLSERDRVTRGAPDVQARDHMNYSRGLDCASSLWLHMLAGRQRLHDGGGA